MTAGVLAICIARQEPIQAALSPAPNRAPDTAAKDSDDDDVSALTAEVRELREEVEQQDVVDQVLDNTWFNWVSIAGTAVIAASFFTEAYLRRREISHADTVEDSN